MNRIQVLASRPKRTLSALFLVLAAVGVAIGSGASFTAQTANPSNTFTAGSLTMSNSKSGAAVLTASNLRPGDVTTGTVDIANTGSLSGAFSLSRSALTDTPTANPLSAKLNLVVKDCGDFAGGTTPTCDPTDPTPYTGTLAAMTGSTALGNYAAAEKHRYEFKVTFDSNAGNVYQGGSSTATFQWDAIS